MVYIDPETQLPLDMSGKTQYALAITVDCTWPDCLATAGTRCNGKVFTQYPHYVRLERALALRKETLSQITQRNVGCPQEAQKAT